MVAQSVAQARFCFHEVFPIHVALQCVLLAEHTQLQILEPATTDCGLQTMRGAELAERGVHDGSGLVRRSAKGRRKFRRSARALQLCHVPFSRVRAVSVCQEKRAL